MIYTLIYYYGKIILYSTIFYTLYYFILNIIINHVSKNMEKLKYHDDLVNKQS